MKYLLLLVPLLASAQADPASRAMNQSVEPYRIVGNLYYVGANDVTSFLIATPAGLILIDGGFAETVPIIRGAPRSGRCGGAGRNPVAYLDRSEQAFRERLVAEKK
jgi:hypothetical protein